MPEENVSKKQEKHSLDKRILGKMIQFGIPFFIGFFVHTYIFPDILPQTLNSYAKSVIGIQEPILDTNTQGVVEKNPDILIRQVDYADGTFSPSVVRVHYGNYISIRNVSKIPEDLMWLVSDSPEITTPRGFAESEHLQKTLLKEGTFTVSNKLRPDSKLTVIVYR